MSFRVLAILLTAVSFVMHVSAQSAQATNPALLRTFMMATNFGRGTTFSVDVDDREYWITAKHMFTGIKTGPAGEFKTKTVQANILSITGDGDEGHDQHWTTENFTVIDPGKDVDILVLAPDHLLLDYPRGFTIKAASDGVGLGGDCEFLGFPYEGGWKAPFQDPKDPNKRVLVWLPYVKHCTPSGELRDKGLFIWVLDGINNEGFSGGPVLSGTGQKQEVFAVISGFHQEPLEVLPVPGPGEMLSSSVPQPPKLPGEKLAGQQREIVNTNSGFVIAFDIGPVIKAIQNNPIGPLRARN